MGIIKSQTATIVILANPRIKLDFEHANATDPNSFSGLYQTSPILPLSMMAVRIESEKEKNMLGTSNVLWNTGSSDLELYYIPWFHRICIICFHKIILPNTIVEYPNWRPLQPAFHQTYSPPSWPTSSSHQSREQATWCGKDPLFQKGSEWLRWKN